MVRSEGNVSLKNPVTLPGIDPGTVRLVAQHLNHYATRDPFNSLELAIFISKVSYYSVVAKSLARPSSRCVLFDGANISFDAGLVIYINSTNIPPITTINRTYENQKLLSL